MEELHANGVRVLWPYNPCQSAPQSVPVIGHRCNRPPDRDPDILLLGTYSYACRGSRHSRRLDAAPSWARPGTPAVAPALCFAACTVGSCISCYCHRLRRGRQLAGGFRRSSNSSLPLPTKPIGRPGTPTPPPRSRRFNNSNTNNSSGVGLGCSIRVQY